MKKFITKVYRTNGSHLKDWENIKLGSFRKSINSGLSECVIELNEKFDYTGNELVLGNIVRIFVSDQETTEVSTGMLKIYDGYISLIVPAISGSKESIRVHLLGHHTKLAGDILKNGTQSTLYTHATAGLTVTSGDIAPADTGLIMKAILARYQAEAPTGAIIYTPTGVEETSADGEYIFEAMTYRDAIDKVVAMSPAGWFWYADEHQSFHFKGKPSTPKHYFNFGQHFTSLEVRRSIEKIKNAMLFWNGETGVTSIFKLYQDAASVNQYGRQVEKYFDWGVGDVATADNMASRFINQAKDPEVEAVCEIVDNNHDSVNGYDIENIQPGDTCAFRGFNDNVADIFEGNMLITDVNYLFDRVALTIQVRKAGLVDWQKEVSRKAQENYSREIPETYSV